MKGGARARSGPSADPNALRRERDKGEWTTLPAEGRSGDLPEWPLSKPSAREVALWEHEWRRPQAVMWERNGQQLEVALYVRTLRDAEKHDAPVASRTLLRQQMDALGLTVPGLRSNRWVIGSQSDQKVIRPNDPDRTSAKSRLRSIEGGAA